MLSDIFCPESFQHKKHYELHYLDDNKKLIINQYSSEKDIDIENLNIESKTNIKLYMCFDYFRCLNCKKFYCKKDFYDENKKFTCYCCCLCCGGKETVVKKKIKIKIN